MSLFTTLAPLSQPIKCETDTNRHVFSRVSSHSLPNRFYFYQSRRVLVFSFWFSPVFWFPSWLAILHVKVLCENLPTVMFYELKTLNYFYKINSPGVSQVNERKTIYIQINYFTNRTMSYKEFPVEWLIIDLWKREPCSTVHPVRAQKDATIPSTFNREATGFGDYYC